MARYRYRARRRDGSSAEGVLEAASRDTAAQQLLAQGLIPLALSEAQERPNARATRRLFQPQPSLADLLLFTRQFYSLTKAGVPILSGLMRIAENTPNAILAEALRQIVRDLQAGRSLAASLARHPKIFPTLYIAMVQVGEESGKLEEALLRLSENLERDRTTVMRIKSALRYPLIVLIATGVAVGVLTTFVIPAFAGIFASMQAQLPLPTRIILAVSHFMANYWWLVVALIAAGALAFRRWTASGPGRYWWDRTKLRIPKIGDIVLRATLARFARSFAMAIAAGVPITQALFSVARATDNDYLAEKILAMLNGIERGETLLGTATRSGIFTPIVLQMLAIGEETGRIDEMMTEVAEFYEREVDYDIEHLSDLIEPVMIVILGGLILVLALGIFLPMWEMLSFARR